MIAVQRTLLSAISGLSPRGRLCAASISRNSPSLSHTLWFGRLKTASQRHCPAGTQQHIHSAFTHQNGKTAGVNTPAPYVPMLSRWV